MVRQRSPTLCVQSRDESNSHLGLWDEDPTVGRGVISAAGGTKVLRGAISIFTEAGHQQLLPLSRIKPLSYSETL